MSNILSRLLPEPIRTVNSASFDGTTFLPFKNAAAADSPITNPSRCLIIVNDSGVKAFISWDGTNDNIVIPAGGSFIFDEQSNSVPNSEYCTAAKTQFYARGALSTGLVYLSTFYAA